jgi:hypothetical protein
MNEIAELLQTATINDVAGKEAANELIVKGGPSVATAVLETIQTTTVQGYLPLYDVIPQLNSSEIILVLLDYLLRPNLNLSALQVIFRTLGQSKNKTALQPIIAYLEDKNNRNTFRVLAAEALGELRFNEAIVPLQNVTQEGDEYDLFALPLAAIVALAKLGNDEKASIAVSLANFEPDQNDPDYDPDYDDSSIIRINAIAALQHVVAPHAFEALQHANQKGLSQTRQEVIETMFYLGVKQVIPELIGLVEDDHYDVANNALVRINDLTGQQFTQDVTKQELFMWWDKHQAEYAENTCYRLGKPVWIPDIIALLAQKFRQDEIIKELRIITGQDFDPKPYIQMQTQYALMQIAQKWWEREGHNFERGALYKYGYKQDITKI